MPDGVTRIPGFAGCLCTRCRADLSALVPAAKFCPHCGVRLGEVNQLGFAISHRVVTGYASAMYRLGTHHEFRHNDDEAYRCYGKASRLGNGAARAKVLDLPPAEPAQE